MRSRTTKRSLVNGAALLLLSLQVPHAFGLNPQKALSQYELSSWSSKNGFSPISVMSVAQTPDGFLWLATEEGLVRFDGLSFVTFDNATSPPLGDRFIRSLASAADGSLWIGTRSGIALLKDGVFRDFRRETNFYEDVYDLCAGRDGALWFSSAEGLHRYKSGVTTVYTTADGLPHNGITALAEAPDGAVWIGTRSGLARMQNGKFTVFGKGPGPGAISVNALTVGSEGTVWFGTLDGTVGSWREGVINAPLTVARGADVRPECLREDRDGNLWVALSHSGLVRMRNNKVERFSGRDDLTIANPDWLFEDRERTLWIGTADAGLRSLRDGKFINFGTPEGLSSDHVTSVLESRSGSIWAGTEDAGLNRLDGERVTHYTAAQGLREKSVMALLQGRDDTIFVGSQDGLLSRIEGDRAFQEYRSSIAPPPRLSAMLEDSANRLWLGFEVRDGLTLYRKKHMESVHLKGRVRGLAADSFGSLWIASYGEGLVQVSKSGQRVYGLKDGLSSLLLTSVFVDTEDTVWAGTALAGINRLKNGRIAQIGADQGLFDSSVGAILEDDYGYLWITSSRGLSRVSKRELSRVADGAAKSAHTESFGYADGLRSQEFTIGSQPAAWKARDGKLWFATMGGLAAIDPKNIVVNPITPEVHFESLSVNGKLVPPSPGVRLAPFTGRLEIAFAAPSFVSPDRVHVVYRLVNYETRWTDAGSTRRAAYTNLPPGKYSLEVRAANSDLRWGPTASLAFECRPYFHQTLWFRILCAFAAVLLGWGIYRWRVRYFKIKTAELEQRIKLRTSDLQKAIEAARAAQALLWEQAMRDSLTGLLNRRAILDLLDTQCQQCNAPEQRFSILLVDLDHFKSINDTYGHLTGDKVLQEVSGLLTARVRRGECVGRYGGEEILIILPDCSLPDAVRRGDELRLHVSRHPVETQSGALVATCSIGVAEFQPGSSPRILIGDADAALYEAKAAGRDCVRSRRQTPRQANQLVETKATLPAEEVSAI